MRDYTCSINVLIPRPLQSVCLVMIECMRVGYVTLSPDTVLRVGRGIETTSLISISVLLVTL